MNEYELKYTGMIAELNSLFKKISGLYDFFSSSNRYISKIPFQRKKLTEAKDLIESVSRKKIEFNRQNPDDIINDLSEINRILDDSKNFLSQIVHEIEKKTGKIIRFRSEM